MRRFALLLLITILGAAAPASAATPRLLDYQGTLTDEAGAPLPDGSYAMTFAIYDTAAGGAPLWTETRSAVPVQGGVFSVVLGIGTALDMAFDSPCWLGVAVSPDPELTPRVRLTAVPYAFTAKGLELPFTGTATSPRAALKVGNDGAGPALTADGPLEVGSNDHSGDLRLFRAGVAGEMVRSATLPRGGYSRWYDEAGNEVASLEADATGTGGFLSVMRDAANEGFIVNGNGGQQEPVVTIAGSARSAVFDMAQSGNASVSLPIDAIGSSEMSDEPGVVSYASSLSTMLNTPGLHVVMTRTLNAPDDGYVLAIASGTARALLNQRWEPTDPAEATFGIARTSAALESHARTRIRYGSALPDQAIVTPLVVQGVFQVSAGLNEFYLLAELPDVGTLSPVATPFEIEDRQLTLVFLPTAYGSVTSLAAGSPPPPAWGESERAAEAAETRRVSAERGDRELARMAAELEALKRDLAADRAARRDGRGERP